MMVWFLSAFIILVILSSLAFGKAPYCPVTASLLGIMFWFCIIIGTLKTMEII